MCIRDRPYIVTALMFLAYESGNPYFYPIAQIIIFSLIVIGLAAKFLLKSDFKLLIHNFKKVVLKSFKFGAPMVLGALSATGLNVADRIIINISEGDIDVANYTVAYTIASILTAFFMATNKWWQRFMLVNLKEDNISKLRKTIWKYVAVVFSVALFINLFSRQLVLLFSNDEYLGVISIIPTLLLGMLFYFLYTLMLNIPFYYKNTFFVILPALMAFVVNTVLNIILIPKKGYEIAATTTTIAYFVEFLIIYIICKKKYNLDLLFGKVTLN